MAKEKDNLLITPAFVLGYHDALWKPQQGTGEDGKPSGAPKYSIKAIWDPATFNAKDKALWTALLAELDKVSKAAFDREWAKLPSNIKHGIREGSEDPEYVGDGKYFASMGSLYPVGVINLVGDEIPEGDSQIYNGAICRAQVNVYAFKHPKNKGISLGIRNLQKLKDGKKTGGGGQSAKEAFADPVDEEYLADLGGQNEEASF